MCQGGTQLRLQPAFLEWESKPRYILLCWQTLWSPAKSETQSKDAQFEFLLNTRKEENVVVTVFLLPSFYIPPNSAHCSGGCFSIREEVCLLTGTLSAAKGRARQSQRPVPWTGGGMRQHVLSDQWQTALSGHCWLDLLVLKLLHGQWCSGHLEKQINKPVKA